MKGPVFPPDFRLDPPPPFTSCNPLNRDYSSPNTSSISPSSTSQPPQVNTIWVLQRHNVSPELLPQLQSRSRNLSLLSSQMPTSQDCIIFSSPDFLQLPQILSTQNHGNFANSFALTNEAVIERHSLLPNLSLSSSQIASPHHSSNSSCTDLMQLLEVPTTLCSRDSPNLSSLSHVAISEHNNLLTNFQLQSTQMTTRQHYGNSDVFQFPLVPTSQCGRDSTNLPSLSHVSVPEDHSCLQNLELPTTRYHSNSPDLLHSHQIPTLQCRKNSATLLPVCNVLVSEDRSDSNHPRLSEVSIPRNSSNSPNLLSSLKVPTPQTHRNSTNLHPFDHTPVTEDYTYSSNRPPLSTHCNSKVTRPQNHNFSLKLLPPSQRSGTPCFDYTQHETICLFCKRNGETSEVYRSHNLKDKNGRITCPILFKYVCPTCQATGENAHTKLYCPANRQAISIYKIGQRCNPTGHPVYIEP